MRNGVWKSHVGGECLAGRQLGGHSAPYTRGGDAHEVIQVWCRRCVRPLLDSILGKRGAPSEAIGGESQSGEAPFRVENWLLRRALEANQHQRDQIREPTVMDATHSPDLVQSGGLEPAPNPANEQGCYSGGSPSRREKSRGHAPSRLVQVIG